MEQSIVTPETLDLLVAKAEGIISRKLEDMEKALMEYAIDQIRLGLVEVK